MKVGFDFDEEAPPVDNMVKLVTLNRVTDRNIRSRAFKDTVKVSRHSVQDLWDDAVTKANEKFNDPQDLYGTTIEGSSEEPLEESGVEYYDSGEEDNADEEYDTYDNVGPAPAIPPKGLAPIAPPPPPASRGETTVSAPEPEPEPAPAAAPAPGSLQDNLTAGIARLKLRKQQAMPKVDDVVAMFEQEGVYAEREKMAKDCVGKLDRLPGHTLSAEVISDILSLTKNIGISRGLSDYLQKLAEWGAKPGNRLEELSVTQTPSEYFRGELWEPIFADFDEDSHRILTEMFADFFRRYKSSGQFVEQENK